MVGENSEPRIFRSFSKCYVNAHQGLTPLLTTISDKNNGATTAKAKPTQLLLSNRLFAHLATL